MCIFEYSENTFLHLCYNYSSDTEQSPVVSTRCNKPFSTNSTFLHKILIQSEGILIWIGMIYTIILMNLMKDI